MFCHVLEDECQYYLARLGLGPLSFRVREGLDWTECRVVDECATIPTWVEEDGLEFLSCDVLSILVTECDATFKALFREKHLINDAGLIVATGHGLPRAHFAECCTACNQYEITTFVLNDNDTWGYFGFAPVKRKGSSSPVSIVSFLSISPHVAYLWFSRALVTDTYHLPT